MPAFQSLTGMHDVMLRFTDSGRAKWTALTGEAVTGRDCVTGDEGRCRVAFAVDATVRASPQIREVL